MTEVTCIRSFADSNQIRECKKKANENESTFPQLLQQLALAGSNVRLNIEDISNMSVPAISLYSRKIKDGCLPETRRAGQTIVCSLKKDNPKLFKPLFKHITLTINNEIA